MRARGSTLGLHSKRLNWGVGEGSGIRGVAVKCVVIRRNAGGEGGLLGDD